MSVAVRRRSRTARRVRGVPVAPALRGEDAEAGGVRGDDRVELARVAEPAVQVDQRVAVAVLGVPGPHAVQIDHRCHGGTDPIAAERVAQAGEQAVAVAVARAEVGLLLPAQRSEAPQEVGLLLVQPRRHDDLDVHHEVAVPVDPAGGAQPRHPLAAQGAHRPVLRAGLDGQLLDTRQRRQVQRGAQRGGGHRQLDRAVQVCAVPGEELVREPRRPRRRGRRPGRRPGRPHPGGPAAPASRPPHPPGCARRRCDASAPARPRRTGGTGPG